VKFHARLSDTCWLCGKPLYRTEDQAKRINRKIDDGYGIRPHTCRDCNGTVYMARVFADQRRAA
jgi:Zn-finger protein